MEYRFYQRKEEGISEKESEWINQNLVKIANKEKVLFAYQGKYETLLLTDKYIHFPSRVTLQKLSYKKIKKIKDSGSILIDIICNDKTTYCIVLTDSISKEKLLDILILIKENFIKNKETQFKEIEKIFDESLAVKHIEKQDQHKIPQVYLKHFGYKRGEQWMVSVLKKGEKFTRQKSIGSFTAITNVFDINGEDEKIIRTFENLNRDLENEYVGIIKDINENEYISAKSQTFLLQILPNLIVRSDYWRDFVKMALEGESKEDFLKVTLMHTFPSFQDFNKLKEKGYYKYITEGGNNKDKLNRVLLFFMSYLFNKIRYFDVVILVAPEGKDWFTSNNPVIFNRNQAKGKLGVCGSDSEFYLPLSKAYLAYFHFSNSQLDTPVFRTLKNKKRYLISNIITAEEYDKLVREVIGKNPHDFLICPFEMKYRFGV